MKFLRPHMPSVVQITLSVFLGLVTIWFLGFVIFFGIVASQAPEREGEAADLAVVLTGGPGRIEEGFNILVKGQAKALLISGVHPAVKLQNLIELWPATPEDKQKLLTHCCIYLDYKAESTESNATQTFLWSKQLKKDTIRIVTSDYHMPRAWILFKRAIPHKTLMAWPVRSVALTSLTFWRNMVIEYGKTLLTWMA